MNAAPSPYAAVLAAPFAALGLRVDEDWLTGIDYLPPGTPGRAPSGYLAREAARQIRAYLADPRFGFDLPVHLAGTPFQRRVWAAIAAIPPGQVRSYGEVARQLHTAPRAVGGACGANPVPLVVPCHRVVAAGGALGGFMGAAAGPGQDIKRWLLEHESR